jgi:hypothetical protein
MNELFKKLIHIFFKIILFKKEIVLWVCLILSRMKFREICGDTQFFSTVRLRVNNTALFIGNYKVHIAEKIGKTIIVNPKGSY